MVRRRRKNNCNRRRNQGSRRQRSEAIKIKASTPHGFTQERMTPYGGLLGLVKLWDGLGFEDKFDKVFVAPRRKPMLGHLRMIQGLVLLLFIGFCRIGHFVYVDRDPMVLGILRLKELPVVSTFWRYLRSLALNQANSLLRLNAALLATAWTGLGRKLESIHIDIDTTVETVYGEIEGARVAYNPKNRGKKSLRPVLAFIAETHEYLAGKLRNADTISGKEARKFIERISRCVPGCVRRVVVRADAEFFAEETLQGCEKAGYHYIIAIRRCSPVFKEERWYADKKDNTIEYNDCWYRPHGWQKARRFVAMRIAKEEGDTQGRLFTDYTYRIFVTDMRRPAHKGIQEYDRRAAAENLIGEARREGIVAIPSKRFHSNMAFFQVVMLAYNLWRWLKAFDSGGKVADGDSICTVRVSRLKILFWAAKIVTHSGQTKVNYSRQSKAYKQIDQMLKRLDRLRHKRTLQSAYSP